MDWFTRTLLRWKWRKALGYREVSWRPIEYDVALPPGSLWPSKSTELESWDGRLYPPRFWMEFLLLPMATGLMYLGWVLLQYMLRG